MIQTIHGFIRQSAGAGIRFMALMLAICAVQLPAQAAIVGTETLIADQVERAKVAEFLQRDQVREALEQQGVDPAVALERVDRLTSAEVALLSEKIDELPAGGDIIGAALLVFFVLLATDILGYTSVFPFVNR